MNFAIPTSEELQKAHQHGQLFLGNTSAQLLFDICKLGYHDRLFDRFNTGQYDERSVLGAAMVIGIELGLIVAKLRDQDTGRDREIERIP